MVDETEIDWYKKIDEFIESGLGPREFCDKQGLPIKKFGYYRYSKQMKKKYPLVPYKKSGGRPTGTFDWGPHVAKFVKSGLTSEEYCTREGLNRIKFEYERYRPKMKKKYPLKKENGNKKQSIANKFVQEEQPTTEKFVQAVIQPQSPMDKLKLFIDDKIHIELPADITKEKLKHVINLVRED